MTAEWDLAVHEEAILEQACRAADRLGAMAGELAAAPLTVTNCRGDLTPHPLLCESRQTAALLARLCAALGLPAGDQDPAAGRRTTSRRGHRGYYNLTPGA